MTAGPVVPIERRLLALRPIVDGYVKIVGGFWGARQRLNREVTIPYGMKMLEQSGTIENFRIAAGTSQAEYQMPLFRDSDLYKVLEAIAWERAHGPQPEQERFFSASVEQIEAAQEADGYLNSYVQVVKHGRRFGDPAMGHELYCAGHLMQASVADTRTRRGAGALAGIADRFAHLLVDVLPSDQADFVPGHPEIETALIEMYRTGQDRRLLELAADLIGRRGRSSLSWHSFGPSYFQDDVPFEAAMTVRGHAVRALYLLAGATDLYTETGRAELLLPVLAQWRDMISAKTYITGGIGSRHKDEAFGDPYELPPDRAYCETCAAIASIMWNWRLLLLTGEAAYAELMERTLYNGFLAGSGLDGTSFFYVNPLQSCVPSSRQPWYDCACCPPNIMRLLASLEHYLATRTDDGVQLHQYVPGQVRAEQPGGGALELAIATGYPFDGAVQVCVAAAPGGPLEIALRLPTWAKGHRCTLNGRSVGAEPNEKGYLCLRHDWSVGDEIVLELPLRPRVVEAAGEIDGARHCVAYERGPLVYCLEGIDLPKGVDMSSISINPSTPPAEEPGVDVAGEAVVALRLDGRAASVPRRPGWPYSELVPHGGAGAAPGVPSGEARTIEVRAMPYYAWANRGATTMRVWARGAPEPQRAGHARWPKLAPGQPRSEALPSPKKSTKRFSLPTTKA